MPITAQALRELELFDDFDPSDLEEVAQRMVARDYPANAHIFVQGDPSPGLWFVRRGRVRIYRLAPSGREFTLCISRLARFPCVGACPLFDSAVCPANAQALEPTTIYFLERELAHQAAAYHPGMARLLSRVLSEHYRHLVKLSFGLAAHCSTRRLVELLLTFADEHGVKTARGIELQLDVTQDVLASMLGTTRQMVAQDLLKLEREGALDAQGRRLTILDPEKMTQMQQV